MSMHSSIMMIESNHLEDLPKMFSKFNYTQSGSPTIVRDWKVVNQILTYPINGEPPNIVQKAVCFINGWTVILDPEIGVMLDNETACIEVSKMFDTRIFGVTCEGTSNSYAYAIFDHELVRSFWSIEGETYKNDGERLPEEPTLTTLMRQLYWS